MDDATWFLIGIIVLAVVICMIGLRLERKHAAKEWALEQEYQQFLAEHGFRPKEK